MLRRGTWSKSSAWGAFQWYVTDPLSPKQLTHPRHKMFAGRCFEDSWVRQWRINRYLEQNLQLLSFRFLWAVMFSQLAYASCWLVGFPTSQVGIQPLGDCAAHSQRNLSSVSWQARTNFLCLVPMSTEIILKFQEKYAYSFLFSHDQCCSPDCVKTIQEGTFK